MKQNISRVRRSFFPDRNYAQTHPMSAKNACELSTVCSADYRCIEHRANGLHEDSEIDEGKDQGPSSYLTQTIFWLLMPALKETLIAASKWNVLRIQKSRFNGLDYLAELLWNYNPRRSRKYSPRLNVFQIPPFKEWLRLHPRPYYPLSWIWSEDEAALRIQRYVRGWLVRKRSDVQEMRQFWKDIAVKRFQQQETSGETWDDAEQGTTDADLDCCKRYRSLYYKEYQQSKAKSGTIL